MAGLAFAIALKQQGAARTRLTVFDRDPRLLPSDRQGYSISINSTDKDGGLVALQRLGLLERALDRSTPGIFDTAFKIWDGTWEELIHVSPKPFEDLPVPGIRIPRSSLRDLLVEEAETLGIDIKWRSQCLEVERLGDGRFSITTENVSDVSKHMCDILIAADGARSKIRSTFRPNDTLNYAGAVQWGGIANFPEGIPAPLNNAWGLVVTGKGNSLFCSRIGETTVVWGLSKMEQKKMGRGNLTAADRQALIAESRKHCKEIHEPFASLLNATDPATVFSIPAMDKLPFSHEGIMSGAIFIGDSNHAVSPFAGNGANLALQDGLNLAELLHSSDSLQSAVAAYDLAAVSRAQKTLKSSHWRIFLAHITGVKYYLFKSLLRMGNLFMKGS